MNDDAALKQKLQLQIGNNIRQIRAKRQLSQSGLAHRANVSAGLIKSVEQQRRSLTSFTLWKIAKALEVPVDT